MSSGILRRNLEAVFRRFRGIYCPYERSDGIENFLLFIRTNLEFKGQMFTYVNSDTHIMHVLINVPRSLDIQDLIRILEEIHCFCLSWSGILNQ
jgi:hypothetical protein